MVPIFVRVAANIKTPRFPPSVATVLAIDRVREGWRPMPAADGKPGVDPAGRNVRQ